MCTCHGHGLSALNSHSLSFDNGQGMVIIAGKGLLSSPRADCNCQKL